MERPYRYAEQFPYYEPFDPDYLEEVVEEVFGPAMVHWFRPRLVGAERLPASGPAVLAANHSGNSFPYDGMVLDALLWRREGFPRQGNGPSPSSATPGTASGSRPATASTPGSGTGTSSSTTSPSAGPSWPSPGGSASPPTATGASPPKSGGSGKAASTGT